VSRRGWALFIALCFIWGIPYLLIRVAVRELPPASVVFLRTAPAGLLLLPFALRGRQLRSILARWRWVLAFTLTELALPWLLLSHAEERMSSSMAGLLIASLPLVSVALFTLLGVRHRTDGRRLAGLRIGFVGVVALVGIDVSGTSLLAVLEVLIVTVCYAIGSLIISERLSDLPSLGVIAASLLITAAAYAPAGLIGLPTSLSAETIAAMAVLAIVCTAVAFVVFFALVREVGPSRYTLVTYVNPLVAVLLGVALLGEPFTLGIAVGMPLILAGSLLGTAPSRKGLGERPGTPPAPEARPPAS
jgi:drug/metabolite transporter (DMT)-like permease